MIKVCTKMTLTVIDTMGGDTRVCQAARVSTSGEGSLEAAESFGLINALMKGRHGTPFEHGALTFFVRAPIFVWREWHRHRIGMSYNEESARYRKLEPEFWVPTRDRPLIPESGYKAIRPKFVPCGQEEYEWFVQDLIEGYTDAYRRYEERLRRGYAKEAARAGLPVGIFSSCWVTCNPRSLMSFLSLRTHDPEAKFVSYPQYEIEEAARLAERALRDGWPLVYKAFCENGRVAP